MTTPPDICHDDYEEPVRLQRLAQNIADREAWVKSALQGIEAFREEFGLDDSVSLAASVRERLAELEARNAELEQTLKEREDFIDENLADVYEMPVYEDPPIQCGTFKPMTTPKGPCVCRKCKRIAELEAENARLREDVTAMAKKALRLRHENDARIADLEAEIAELREWKERQKVGLQVLGTEIDRLRQLAEIGRKIVDIASPWTVCMRDIFLSGESEFDRWYSIEEMNEDLVDQYGEEGIVPECLCIAIPLSEPKEQGDDAG